MATDYTHRGTCARCHRPDLTRTAKVPEGRICASCWSTATRTTGACTTCRRQRLLPGRDPTGAPLCTDCADLGRDFHCARCGREWFLRHGGLCEWCFLDDTLEPLIGTGHVDLAPLRQQLLAVDRPDSIIIWLYNDNVTRILTGLAAGTIDLTHDGLDRQQPRRSADHIAGLLVTAGLLAHRNVYLTRYDRWVNERLPTTCDPANQLLLQQFARWRLRPGLAAAARAGTARTSMVVSRTQQLTVAGQFLEWLTDAGVEATTMTQRHLDAWLAGPPATRRIVAGFIRFLGDGQFTADITMPQPTRPVTVRMGPRQRLEHLRASLDPATGPLDARTAAMLLLLYAQPFPILTNLRHDHIDHDRQAQITTITFARDPVDVPPPFDAILIDQLANRAWTSTAANNDTTWLFPGRRPGLPLTEASLQRKVRNLGIVLRHAKAAALADLVTACPPPVVARMLGYSNTTTNRHAQAAGTTWQHYPSRRHPPTR